MRDLVLYPDDYTSSKSYNGKDQFKSQGFVLGLDQSDYVVSSSKASEIIPCLFLKTLLTKKGSVVTRPNEGTLLASLLSTSNLGSTFEADLIDCVMDAEKQVKIITSGVRALLNANYSVKLSSATVLGIDRESAKLSVLLNLTDGTTSILDVTGNKL
jgi:hypothetical protein